MNLVTFIDFLRDRLQKVILWCCIALGALVVLDILRVVLGWGAHEAPASAEHAAAAAGHAAAHAEHAAPAAEASHGFLTSLYHFAETKPVFWSVFGFVACVLIVYVSKWYGHLKVGKTEIMTREDYYNE